MALDLSRTRKYILMNTIMSNKLNKQIILVIAIGSGWKQEDIFVFVFPVQYRARAKSVRDS